MHRMTLLAPLTMLALAACSSNEATPPRGGPGGDGGFPAASRSSPPGAGDPFSRAARLVDQGQYQQALPALRCIASQGQGYEIAQYLAGYASLRLAEDDATPEILRDEFRVDGFDRLIAAGNAGWPAAQAALAEAFASTSGDVAETQAGYWAAVYRRNTRDRAYGLDRLDNEIERGIAASLTPDEREQADAAATAFIVTPMERVEAGPECAPFLRQAAGAGLQRAEGRGRNGPGGGRGGGGRGGGRGGGGRGGGPY